VLKPVHAGLLKQLAEIDHEFTSDVVVRFIEAEEVDQEACLVPGGMLVEVRLVSPKDVLPDFAVLGCRAPSRHCHRPRSIKLKLFSAEMNASRLLVEIHRKRVE